jgi:hypothetical protein
MSEREVNTTLGATTVQVLTDYWGYGPEDWGLPADTDPASTVYIYRSEDGGIMLEVEYAGQERLPITDRKTAYIESPDGGFDGFTLSDLPSNINSGRRNLMTTETWSIWFPGGGTIPGDGVKRIITLEVGETPWQHPSGTGSLVTDLEAGETMTICEARQMVEAGDREPVDYIYWHRGDELWIAPVGDDGG